MDALVRSAEPSSGNGSPAQRSVENDLPTPGAIPLFKSLLASYPFAPGSEIPFRRIERKGLNMSKAVLWIGRVISAVPVLLLLMGGVMDLSKAPVAIEGLKKFGYPEHVMIPFGIVCIVCALLYAIPQTAFLGAILMTGYFGGAVATHVRIDDPGWYFPIIIGILVWLGLLLRERRLRPLLPWRS
jgi:hypothetical protein